MSADFQFVSICDKCGSELDISLFNDDLDICLNCQLDKLKIINVKWVEQNILVILKWFIQYYICSIFYLINRLPNLKKIYSISSKKLAKF
jgi:hypothetical protein